MRCWFHLPIYALVVLLPLSWNPSQATAQTRILIIDGQNNHKWQETTPLIQRTLEATGLFQIDVATFPSNPAELGSFKPDFSPYAAVVSNYNGAPWPEETQKAFEQFVASGKGFVSVHAANNSFPNWSAYNRMIGLGGWGNRNEKDGPYVRWKEDRIVRENQPGRGGSHGARHPFVLVVRDAEHPITAGLPTAFMQAEDELYAELRGPAENLHVLATAFSDPGTNGTGQNEPILMTVHYGEGRVFHTTLGHDVKSMNGLAFQITLQRGTQWAATGKVTLDPAHGEQLTSNSAVMRDPATAGTMALKVDMDLAPNPRSEGWEPLFNGENLEGWTQKNGTASFAAEEGAVVGRTAVGSPNSFLCTTNDYRNFELTFEVKVDDGLNSGVQIRSRSLPEYQSGRVHGPQVEIEALDDQGMGDAGYIYSEATGRNWLSTERVIQDAFKNGEWNRYHVRAVGDRLQTWLNGTKIEDLTDPESFDSGFIGLQVHGIPQDQGPFEVRWRDIQIRTLSDDCTPIQ